jgi:hypothetical protein
MRDRYRKLTQRRKTPDAGARGLSLFGFLDFLDVNRRAMPPDDVAGLVVKWRRASEDVVVDAVETAHPAFDLPRNAGVAQPRE